MRITKDLRFVADFDRMPDPKGDGPILVAIVLLSILSLIVTVAHGCY